MYTEMSRYFHILLIVITAFNSNAVIEVVAELEVAELSRKEDVDFASEILPIFRKNCLACHNAKDADGDLNLETPKSIREGGESGPMVIPGNANKSLLMEHIRQSKKPFMPPRRNKVGANNLTPYQLGLIKLWINQGAKGEVKNVTAELDWRPIPLSINPIYTTAISPDGQFAACGRGNQIFIYHLPTQRLVSRLNDTNIGNDVAHRDLVQSLAFSPDSMTLASGGFRLVKLWSNQYHENLRIVNFMSGGEKVVGIDVDREKNFIVVIGDLGTVRVFNSESMMPIWHDHVNGQSAKHLQISPDGNCVAVLFSDDRVRTWNIADGDRMTRESSPLNVGSFAWVDNNRIVSAHGEEGIKIWSVNNPDRILSQWETNVKVSALLVAKNLPAVFVGQEDGKIRVINALDGKLFKVIDHGELVSAMRLNKDESQLLILGGPVAKLWDIEKWSLIGELKGAPIINEELAHAEQELAFFKGEIVYHKNTIESKEKQLKQDKDAHKKAKDVLVGHKKTAAAKRKEKSESESSLNKLNKEIADLPKRIEVAGKEKSNAEKIFKAIEGRINLSKNELIQLDKKLQDASLEKAKLVGDLMKLGAIANNAKILAEDTLSLAEKTEGNKDLKSQAIVAKALADRKLVEFEGLLSSFSIVDKKLVSLERDRGAVNKSIVTDEIPFNEAKGKLEEVSKELIAAQDRQKKSGDEKKNISKKISDAAAAIENSEREIELSEAEVGFTATNVKNAENNLIDAKKDQERALKLPPEHEAAVNSIKARVEAFSQDWVDAVYSDDQSLVFTLGVNGRVQAWSAINGQRVYSLDSRTRLVKCMGMLNGGRLALAGGSSEMEVVDAYPVWSLAGTIGTGDEESQFEDRVLALDFSPDGEKLATGGGFPSRGGEIYIWNLEDKSEELRIPQAHSDTVCSLRFSPDGSKLASGGTDRFARIFETERGRELHALEGHTGHVLGISWQRNSRVLASVGADKAVKIWNLINGEQKKSFSGFNKEVTSVHFLGIGTQVLLSAGDNSVRVVKEDGGEVKRFPQTSSFMHSSDVTPDGKLAVAGGFDGVLRVWDVSSGKLLYKFEPSVDTLNLVNKD